MQKWIKIYLIGSTISLIAANLIYSIPTAYESTLIGFIFLGGIVVGYAIDIPKEK